MVAFNDRLTNEATNALNTKQNEVINLFRLLVCFMVISIHVHSDTPLSTQWISVSTLLCVPYFFSTSLFFFTKKLTKKLSITSVLNDSWLRIGIPFITWSTVYIVLLVVKHTITGSGQPMTFSAIIRAYLYGGSAEHLYYLPELIIMQALIVGIFTISRHTTSLLSWLLLFVSAFYLGWGYVHNYYGMTPLITLTTYIVCAFLLTADQAILQHKKIYLITGFLLLILIITHPYLYLSPSYSLPIGGIGLLLIALSTRSFTIPTWVQLTSSATYGIYLSHVLFLEAFEFILEKTHTQLFYTLPVKLSVTLFIFLISLVFTLTIRRIPFFRVIFLGEKQKAPTSRMN